MPKGTPKCPPDLGRGRLRLDVLLESRAEEMASDWAARILEDPASPYRNLPQEDLFASTLGLIRSIARALGPEGENAPLKERLTDLAVRRLMLGFPIGTVIQALLLGKEVLAPYILEAYEHDPSALCAGMALLDEHMRQATVYLSNRYAAEMELRLREEQERALRNARQLATLEERERLAGEMHDRLAQALGYLNMGLSGVDDLLARGEVDNARLRVAELKQAAKQTYTDVREAIFNLRIRSDPRSLFLPTLREYLAEYRNRYGVRVDLVVEDESLTQFSPEVRIQVLRIVQEALTNVRKHAGADQAWIRIEEGPEAVRISIEDGGQGFDLAHVVDGSEGGFFGLQIMHERAKAVGGTLDVQSAPGRGTRIVLDVPFPERSQSS